jgi:hypothetical protein
VVIQVTPEANIQDWFALRRWWEPDRFAQSNESATTSRHVYEVRPRPDRRRGNLISDVLRSVAYDRWRAAVTSISAEPGTSV